MDVDDDNSKAVVASAALTAVGSKTAPMDASSSFALLKGAVKASPTDYGAHLNFVGYLRRERPGSLDLLKARQDFSARFPLSAELWQEWIEDRMAAGGEDSIQEALALYDRAFSDYQCAKLWPGYLETLESSLDEDDDAGVHSMREGFERALSKVGVHPVLGGAVWKSYLRFEKDELEDAEETEAGDAEVSKALDRVKSLYRRQLSVPLVGNDDVLVETREAFSGDGDGVKAIVQAHAKASDMLESRMEHEEAIARCQQNDPGGPAAASAWETYAAFEAAEGHPSRAVLVLERAESEGCCLHERIWITHSDLLLAGMGAKGPEATLTARAVRNLPWSAELWCRRLRSLERSSEFSGEGSLEREAGSATAGAGGVVAAVRSVWLEALSNALPSPDDYVKVLLAYCAFFRRSLVAAIILAAKQKTIREASSVAMIGPAMPKALDGGGKGSEGGEDEAGEGAEVSTALEALRGSFEEAEAFVDKNYPGWDEGWLAVVRQRIQVEDEVVEDLAELGLDGVSVESQARRQWERVLRHSGKRLAAWLGAVAWERRGTGDLSACRRLFVRSMKEVEDYPEAMYSAYLGFEQEMGSLQDWDAANREVFQSRSARGLLSKDLPLTSRAWEGGAAARPLHQPTQRSGKKNANVSGKDNTPAGRANKRAGSGHGDDDPAGASKRARTARNGSAGAKGRGQGEAMESGGDEGLTAFVVNLAFSTKEKGLRAIFAGCGAVTEAKVLMTPQGRSKGMGYVAFANEEALANAIALDGAEIDGRAITVQKSLPRGSRPAKGSTTSSTGSGTDGNRVDQKTNASSAVSSSSPTVTEAFTGKPSSGSIGIGVGGTTGNGNGTDNSSGKGNGNGNGNGKRNGSHDGAETADSAGPEPAKKGRKKKKRGKEGEFVVAEGGGGGGGQGQGARGAGIKWPVHPTTVFVRGLGLTATSGMLRDAFAGVGALVEARVVADKKTQETKGYGLVQFEEADAVEKALALNGTDMCGGKAKITRSRHPAVVVPTPTPAPTTTSTTASENLEAPPAAGGTAAGAPTSERRANDWDCVNPECDNVCFSFRTKCNRCGTGRDGTPPAAGAPVNGGGVAKVGAGGAEVPTLHRPRLQLGSSIRPRALRKEPVRNGRAPAAAGGVSTAGNEGGGGEGGRGQASAPPPSNKSNADFRAMLNKK